MESTDQLNTEESLLNFLLPYLKVLRSMVPQDYLLPDIHQLNPLNQVSQQIQQSSVVNTNDSFFRQQAEIEQRNKREAVGSDFLSIANSSNPEFDSLDNIDLNIPADQLDDFIKELKAELCEPEQKKIKMEPY